MRKGRWETSTSYKMSNHEGRPRETEQGYTENRMVEMSVTGVAKCEAPVIWGKTLTSCSLPKFHKIQRRCSTCCCHIGCCQYFPFSRLEMWGLLETSLATTLKDPFLYNKQMISRSHITRLVELTFKTQILSWMWFGEVSLKVEFYNTMKFNC